MFSVYVILYYAIFESFGWPIMYNPIIFINQINILDMDIFDAYLLCIVNICFLICYFYNIVLFSIR